ncbi:ABC transporter ATP-binding protein [Nonomuraea sp. K274]|uniref:ABC transporter ATP-binding protein n=1 Tax=Nonomuraea cypriaca TaxID=1187855 RepID=A0A931F2C5_9ACTN|nr:ABC transporter ATP-binding protein [Nonomuraea cypriaca]MBF8191405.1 ABC transporter ATP-binding protein [Nonomuraea cypriaca]
MTAPVLRVEDLSVEFATREGTVRAVRGVGLEVHAGRTLAVLGESGSGKSVTAQTIMGLLDMPPARITSGSIVYDGTDLVTADERTRMRVNGEGVAMVFQDALSALNPVYTVGHQLGELLRVRRKLSSSAARAKAVELMERVRIPAAASRVDDYPHQFSGGMRQRIMIALAVALDPRVLIADEPTTALDVTVQAQIMQLLKELQHENGMGLVLITHDLGVVAEVADDVVVMYAGRIVERGTAEELFERPAHPYTRGLLRSMPRPDREDDELWAIPGAPPSPVHAPGGCAFHPRCDTAIERCRSDRPVLVPVAPGRASACHLRQEVFDASA